MFSAEFSKEKSKYLLNDKFLLFLSTNSDVLVSRSKDSAIENPFRVVNDRYNSADLIHEAIQPPKLSELSKRPTVNHRIGKSNSADLVMCFRNDSLNEINIFEE